MGWIRPLETYRPCPRPFPYHWHREVRKPYNLIHLNNDQFFFIQFLQDSHSILSWEKFSHLVIRIVSFPMTWIRFKYSYVNSRRNNKVNKDFIQEVFWSVNKWFFWVFKRQEIRSKSVVVRWLRVWQQGKTSNPLPLDYSNRLNGVPTFTRTVRRAQGSRRERARPDEMSTDHSSLVPLSLDNGFSL